MRITWHLEPTSSSSHSFALTYRADGVVRQEEGADALFWQALPDDYEYFIGESETVVNYPSYTALIAEPAAVGGHGRYQPIPQPGCLQRSKPAAQFSAGLQDGL